MLVTPESTASFARREAGGKGYNLYRMSRLGLPVPPWVAVSRSTFDRFIATSGIGEPIRSACRELPASEAAVAIERLIANAPLSADVLDLIRAAWSRVAGTDAAPIAVRSSAADEDGAQFSFAGQLSSFLYVSDPDQALQRVRLCWASGYSARALAYRAENGLATDGVGVAVVFQRMLDPRTSGVLFTCDPATASLDRYVVSAVYGVGEGLVSGALDADTYWVDPTGNTPLRRQIADKHEAFRRGATGGCVRVPVDGEACAAPCLDVSQLHELVRLGQTLHTYFDGPQDVEWACVDNRLFLLQTRPVTTLPRNSTGTPNVWDNSNIVESYGGLTLPLSFSFALRNYRSVYVQFCELLRVPREVIKDMEPVLGRMLGCIQGRVYYNLYNWYKLVGVLPGFRNNRQFMETMMGVRQTLSPEIADRIRPHPSWDTWPGRMRRFRAGLVFLGYHFRIQGVVDRFLRDFDHAYQDFRGRPYDRMSSDRIFEAYLDMERVMIRRWKAPIVNDFLVMVHFGLFRKLTERWLGDADPNIQNDLLAGDGHLESAAPTHRLMELAATVAAQPELRDTILGSDERDLLEILNQRGFSAFFKDVLDYLDRFGFRCMNEMKLEETDQAEDPAFFFVCLKNYLRGGSTDPATIDRRRRDLRLQAETRVTQQLHGWRRWVYRWSMKHARRSVRNRENTRFARTRAYGVARAMFRAMGETLCANGILDQARDIFYLEIDEVCGLHTGTLSNDDLKGLVGLRKAAYARYAEVEPDARIFTRGPVYWHNPVVAEAVDTGRDESATADLRGLPCCPGIVEGPVKVVSSPADNLELAGEILVAPRTDPGWVPLYPSLSGLLVERGSLLSHSAIVAREMGLPAIVSIPGLTAALASGMRVRMDGRTGEISILSDRAPSPPTGRARTGVAP